MRKKIILLVILLIILIAAIIATVIIVNKINNNESEQNNQEEFVEILDNGVKQNISTKLKETKVLNGLEISNISFYMKNGQTTLEADVKNNSGKDIDTTGVNIVLLDKEGNEIESIIGVINATKNGETSKIITGVNLDFVNAYDFKIEM